MLGLPPGMMDGLGAAMNGITSIYQRVCDIANALAIPSRYATITGNSEGGGVFPMFTRRIDIFVYGTGQLTVTFTDDAEIQGDAINLIAPGYYSFPIKARAANITDPTASGSDFQLVAWV